MNYGKHVNTQVTPQSEPIPGSAQVPNSAGGYSFAVDDWVRLDRFLILGTEGGSYYASERKLTRDNAHAIERLLKVDGLRVVDRIVEISDAGRAPKNDPALFALAMCAKLGDDVTRTAANRALPKVARIGTHLQHYAEYVQAFGGWGRGTRTAVAKWYMEKAADKLAYQLVKYQSRDGWAHRDLLRLAHPIAPTPAHAALYAWAVKGLEGYDAVRSTLLSDGKVTVSDDVAIATRLIEGFERAKTEKDPKAVAKLISEYKLPREAVPTEALNHPEVWEALLPDMGITAVIRNLATMTKIGFLKPLSASVQEVCAKVTDAEALKKGRVHPIQVLAALTTYSSGHGVRGSSSWTPIGNIVDALDEAFYLAFGAIEPTGKRTLLALDVSGSMTCGDVAGVPGLTPRMGSAAMALVTAATEKRHQFVGFSHQLVNINITPSMRLDKVVAAIDRIPMGGTDCAAPMVWAKQEKIEVDTFCVYTDSETWAGKIHPMQALKQYRQKTGIPAKLVVVGMVSNEFTIADPNDAGSLDVVGFDTATPQVISNFSK